MGRLLANWLDSSGNILCFLGVHEWQTREAFGKWWRECRHCLRLHPEHRKAF